MIKSVKRLGAAVLSAVMMLTAVATPLGDNLPIVSERVADVASAETYTYGDYDYYVRDDQTVFILAYTGKDKVVNIPEEIEGKKVGAIGHIAFLSNSIEVVNIPNTVTVLSYECFYKCGNLREINIPESVSEIGGVPVTECPSVEKINVSEKNNYYRSVDGVLFSKDMSQLIYYPSNKAGDSYKVPDEVKEFSPCADNGAFNYNQNLKSVTLNANINLSSWNFPRSSFAYASKLEAIYVDSKNPYLTSDNGILYSKDKTILVSYPANRSQTRYVMPDNVRRMSENAFYGAKNLKEIQLSKKLEIRVYGVQFFLGCRNLESISIPESNNDFYTVDGVLFRRRDYDGLDNPSLISYPQNKKDSKYEVSTTVKSIGVSAFEGNTNLSTVIIPDNVEEINGSAFKDCTSLSKVVLPSNLKEITYWTFNNCSSLTDIDIPASVTTVGVSAFLNCSSLKNVTIPSNVTKIVFYAFGYSSDISDHNVDYQKINDFKIYCYPGTAGEQYAKDNGFAYELLDKPTISNVTGFKVKSLTSTNVTLQWTKNSAASGYEIEQYKGGKWVNVAKITGNATTSYTVKGLAAGTAGYKFRMRAVKNSVYSDYTSALTVNTNPYGVGGFKCSSKSSTSVTLKWNKGTTASGYQLQQYKDGKWVTIYTGTKATNTSYTVKKLKAGTAGYRFRIRAYKTYGNTKQYGSWSSEVKVNTNPYGVGGFKCSSKTSTSVTLKWNKGTTASGYQLQQYKDGKWVTVYTGTKATNTSFTVKKLKAGTAGYRFRIRAYKTYGNTKQYGSWSSEVKVNTNPYGVGGFKVKTTTKNSITLGWNKGTTASGYQLQQYKGGKWVTVYTGTKATNTSYTVKNLKKNTSYKFRIRAYKTYGNTKQYGSWSKELTVRTKK